MKILRLLLSLLLFSTSVWADGSGSKSKVDLIQEFNIRPGTEVLVKKTGLKLRFNGLVDDSRCPEGVDCIWAGNGKISLAVRQGRSKSVSFDLNTMTEPKSFKYENYVITLVKLAPYPKKDKTIRKRDYRATLTVTRITR